MHRRHLIGLLLLLALVACDTRTPLEHAETSAEALAAEVVKAYQRTDLHRLDELAVSEREFREHIWPDLPAAKPERNLPFSYVWGDLHQKSAVSVKELLASHGGAAYQLRSISFAGQTQYGHYVVHREATFNVVDASGTATAVRLCGSFLEKDGVWKVFSYVVDD